MTEPREVVIEISKTHKKHEAVLNELRSEHKHLRANTTTLAKLMAENEAKKAVMKKLEYHLKYYENYTPAVFSDALVENWVVQRNDLVQKQAHLKSEFERVDVVSRAKFSKLEKEKARVYELRKKLAIQEEKLGAKIETRDMVKDEFIKEDALLKNLKHVAELTSQGHSSIHDEVSRITGHVPIEFTGKFESMQILNIGEILKEYHVKVAGEFERLRNMYHDRELELYTSNLRRIEAKVGIQTARVSDYKSDIQRLKAKKLMVGKDISIKTEELAKLKQEGEDGFKARFALLTARYRNVVEECEKIRVKIEATKAIMWKQEDADKHWVDRYNRLILDIQEEIGLYRELMSSTGFVAYESRETFTSEPEPKSFVPEPRYRPTMRGVLTNEQIDSIHTNLSTTRGSGSRMFSSRSETLRADQINTKL